MKAASFIPKSAPCGVKQAPPNAQKSSLRSTPSVPRHGIDRAYRLQPDNRNPGIAPFFQTIDSYNFMYVLRKNKRHGNSMLFSLARDERTLIRAPTLLIFLNREGAPCTAFPKGA